MENEVNFDGQKLREKRKQSGRTQIQVAEFLGIRPQSYYEMEKNLTKPNSNNLAKLCIYFDSPIQDFFQIPEKFFIKI